MLMSAFDDKEYMAWYKQEAVMSNPEIEYGAWLAGRRAAEAQRDELARKLDYANRRIDSLQITLDTINADNTELRTANDTLAKRVMELTAELQQALFDLKEAQINIKGMADHNAKQRYQLQDEITRRESAESGLAEMIKAHSEAMTRLSKYEKVTA